MLSCNTVFVFLFDFMTHSLNKKQEKTFMFHVSLLQSQQYPQTLILHLVCGVFFPQTSLLPRGVKDGPLISHPLWELSALRCNWLAAFWCWWSWLRAQRWSWPCSAEQGWENPVGLSYSLCSTFLLFSCIFSSLFLSLLFSLSLFLSFFYLSLCIFCPFLFLSLCQSKDL